MKHYCGKKHKMAIIAIFFGVSCALVSFLIIRTAEPKELFVKILSRNEVELHGRVFNITIDDIEKSLEQTPKRQTVVFSGGESCFAGDVMHLLSLFRDFDNICLVADGKVVSVCDYYSMIPWLWMPDWQKKFPDKTIIVTIFREDKYDLRMAGNIISDNKEREILRYKEYKHGKEWRLQYESPVFSFSEMTNEMARLLAKEKSIAVSIQSQNNAEHRKTLNVLRICENFNVKCVFLCSWDAQRFVGQLGGVAERHEDETVPAK